MKYPVIFALLTALCWGLYGLALGQARSALLSPFKPYVMIGVAYLIWGIVGGLVGMWIKGDSFSFAGAGGGITWGFISGSLGAFGALALTFAMFTGGMAMPQIVMPIVFGGAVTVAAIASVLTVKGSQATSPWLWVGILAIGVGIVVVAYNTPHAAPPSKAAKADSGQPTSTSAPATGQTASDGDADETR